MRGRLKAGRTSGNIKKPVYRNKNLPLKRREREYHNVAKVSGDETKISLPSLQRKLNKLSIMGFYF
jgi:hypothetical protein